MIFLILSALVSTHGVYSFQSRIVGGSLQPIQNTPWQVAIYSQRIGIPLCGGIILSENYILTAATCVINVDLEDAVVVSGTDDLFLIENFSKIGIIEIHPDFNNSDHNIAVIKLESKIEISDKQKPGKLSLLESSENETVQFTGFGSIHQGFPGVPVAHELRTINITIWSDSQCSDFLTDYSNKNSIICAGIFLRGPCYGDEGGPIAKNDKIIGVSIKRNCFIEYPALFVKVGPYKSFIDSASKGEATWA